MSGRLWRLALSFFTIGAGDWTDWSRRKTVVLSGRVSSMALLLLLCGVQVVAVLPSAASADSCPNAVFRTGPSSRLPDCRAYELVSPPFKNDGLIEEPFLTSSSGSTLVVGEIAGFEGIESDDGLIAARYRLTRTSSGWTTTPLNLAANRFTGFFLAGFGPDGLDWSEDLGSSVWVEREVGEPGNALDFFREGPEGSIADIGTALSAGALEGTPEAEGEMAEVATAGFSADGSRFLFSIKDFFWPNDETQTGSASLYEYIGTCGATAVECGASKRSPRLVGVDDGGKQLSQCGTVLGAGVPSQIGNGIDESHNAVSHDGKIVFFTAYPEITGCKGPPVTELFASVERAPGTYETVAISEPTEEACSACYENKKLKSAGRLAGGEFQGASADGSRVFFTTVQPLLGGGQTESLYEYDLNAPVGEKIVRVSRGDSTVSGPVASVQGTPVQISEDGSRVYFVAQGVLTTIPNDQGQAALAGADNLYLYEDGARYPSGRIAFIADLCSDAGQSGSVFDDRCPSSLNALPAENVGSRNDLRLWEQPLYQGGADTTPDGRFLIFTSYADLTPDDTSSGRQVFEYDAKTDSLVRVSVGQGGFNHDGNTAMDDANIVSPYYGKKTASPSYQATSYWSKLTMSADGSYVFFESSDGLTPQASDHLKIGETAAHPPEPVYANNIYEYHDGAVSLISDGHDVARNGSKSTVGLLGTDAEGRDVYFTTVDSLVGQDTDELPDIYDARIGGGFPAPTVLQPCSEDVCQGPLSAAPTLLSPGSEFQAGGNPLPPPAKPAAKSKTSIKKKAKVKRKAKRTVKNRRGRKTSVRSNRPMVGGRTSRRGVGHE
jgi:hypothetical protein